MTPRERGQQEGADVHKVLILFFLWLETHLVTCMHFKTVTVSQTAPSKQTSTEDFKFLFKKQQ